MQPNLPEPATRKARILEVAGLFLKLGLTAFGGPAAHQAMMYDEVVTRRKWITEERFLELFGAANLIPGPTSTEMAIYLGIQRVGWLGFVLGGVCFILPAMLLVLGLAWAYVQYGATLAVVGVLYGVKPVVIAIILQAVWGMGRKAVKGYASGAAGLAAAVLYLLGVNVLVILLAGGLLFMIVKNIRRIRQINAAGLLLSFGPGLVASSAAAPFSLGLLFLTFLKIGAVLYGSGYVLLAFLRADFVNNLGWLTDRQLIDAVAIGQVTPGPLFTSATFVGYLVGGVPGALLATLAIFLPSFAYVAVSSPLLPRLRRSTWAAAFLDGVTVASLGLMAGVTLELAGAAFVDPLTVITGAVGLFLLFRFRLNSTWLIAGGMLVGLAHTFLL
jgi:chromate transporter